MSVMYATCLCSRSYSAYTVACQ